MSESFQFGGVAQLVERLDGIQRVAGSNPVISTIVRMIACKGPVNTITRRPSISKVRDMNSELGIVKAKN
jgi:hypothetical protein